MFRPISPGRLPPGSEGLWMGEWEGWKKRELLDRAEGWARLVAVTDDDTVGVVLRPIGALRRQ